MTVKSINPETTPQSVEQILTNFLDSVILPEVLDALLDAEMYLHRVQKIELSKAEDKDDLKSILEQTTEANLNLTNLKNFIRLLIINNKQSKS